jgi:hypothetical protein
MCDVAWPGKATQWQERNASQGKAQHGSALHRTAVERQECSAAQRNARHGNA